MPRYIAKIIKEDVEVDNTEFNSTSFIIQFELERMIIKNAKRLGVEPKTLHAEYRTINRKNWKKLRLYGFH